jgi:hypothetical protein
MEAMDEAVDDFLRHFEKESRKRNRAARSLLP